MCIAYAELNQYAMTKKRCLMSLREVKRRSNPSNIAANDTALIINLHCLDCRAAMRLAMTGFVFARSEATKQSMQHY